MKRLIEKIVFSGFVIACRLATWPTRISPSFVKAATEGVRRLPSWLAITVGVPPSTTATTELVVEGGDRKSTRLNSSHGYISYAVFCLKKKNQTPPLLQCVFR